MEIRDKKGTDNVVADHLSRQENHDHVLGEYLNINEKFPDEHIFTISHFFDAIEGCRTPLKEIRHTPKAIEEV